MSAADIGGGWGGWIGKGVAWGSREQAMQATSQESGLLGGSRQGEPQQTAFPILLAPALAKAEPVCVIA